MNKYPHRLGSGGYEGKSEEQGKVLEINKGSDSPVVKIQNPRGQDWLMGRSELTADGRIVLPKEVQPVAQKMVRVFCYNFVSFKQNYKFVYITQSFVITNFLINSWRWRRRSLRVSGLSRDNKIPCPQRSRIQNTRVELGAEGSTVAGRRYSPDQNPQENLVPQLTKKRWNQGWRRYARRYARRLQSSTTKGWLSWNQG